MVPSSVRVPVPSAFAFPNGALGLGVEPIRDFGTAGDNQARDKESGLLMWAVTVMDLDPAAAKFGRERVKVKIAAAVRPVLPESKIAGYPPAVEFTGLVLVPWTDDSKCRGAGECKARLSWSLRASDVIAATADTAAAVAA